MKIKKLKWQDGVAFINRSYLIGIVKMYDFTPEGREGKKMGKQKVRWVWKLFLNGEVGYSYNEKKAVEHIEKEYNKYVSKFLED